MAPKAKPELTYFGLALRRIMKNMGYDFEYPRGLNGGKGITTPLKPYLRKDQEEAMASGGYIDLRPYGLGYQLPIMLPSDSESDSEVSEEGYTSSTTTSWGSAITLPSFMRQSSGDEDEEVQSDADSERSSLKFFKRCTVR